MRRTSNLQRVFLVGGALASAWEASKHEWEANNVDPTHMTAEGVLIVRQETAKRNLWLGVAAVAGVLAIVTWKRNPF